jgi:hypothetical protein
VARLFATVIAFHNVANVGRDGERCTRSLALGDEALALPKLLGEFQRARVELGAEEVVLASDEGRRRRHLFMRNLTLQVQLTGHGNWSTETSTALFGAMIRCKEACESPCSSGRGGRVAVEDSPLSNEPDGHVLPREAPI